MKRCSSIAAGVERLPELPGSAVKNGLKDSGPHIFPQAARNPGALRAGKGLIKTVDMKPPRILLWGNVGDCG